jgi:hypothetical protein
LRDGPQVKFMERGHHNRCKWCAGREELGGEGAGDSSPLCYARDGHSLRAGKGSMGVLHRVTPLLFPRVPLEAFARDAGRSPGKVGEESL